MGRDPDHHFQPGENKLRTALGDRNGLASLLTLGIICLIVFIPLMVILSSLAVELNMVYTKLQQNNTQFPEVIAGIFNRLPDWASGFGGSQPDQRRADPEKLSDVALQGGQYLAGSAFLIGKGTFGFAISFGIMLYLLFFLLKDGPIWCARSSTRCRCLTSSNSTCSRSLSASRELR